jgi:heme exporter protein D
MDLQAFLSMGGYAAYVWSSYGLALIVLAGNIVAAHRRERRILQRLGDEHQHPGDPQ